MEERTVCYTTKDVAANKNKKLSRVSQKLLINAEHHLINNLWKNLKMTLIQKKRVISLKILFLKKVTVKFSKSVESTLLNNVDGHYLNIDQIA